MLITGRSTSGITASEPSKRNKFNFSLSSKGSLNSKPKTNNLMALSASAEKPVEKTVDLEYPY